MMLFKSIVVWLLLAVAMPAQAATYQVTINTASLAGQSGYLDFLMLSLAGADPVQATISNFTGSYSSGTYVYGDVGGSVTSSVSLVNSTAWSEFAQWVNFGGVYSFSVSFSGSSGSGAGTNLGIALLDQDFSYVGSSADIVTFALQPGSADSVLATAGLATVAVTVPSAVPEPAVWALLCAGLMLLARARRLTGS
ncbi:NF038129 family PEP-CTERM protein [Duganella guangzhouensis]|nr:NF038129 family PEP-CTERM protein [Duganella guangzhouensis]